MAGRVQVQDLRSRPNLAPAAQIIGRGLAVGTVRQSIFSELADSLKSIDPGIKALVQARQDQHQEEQTALAEKRIAGLTFDEAKKLRDEGKLAESDDPWYQAALNRSYGLSAARNRATDLQRRLSGENTATDGTNNAFDMANGNIDQWIRDNTKGDLEGNNDRHYIGGYLQVMSQQADQLRGAYAKYKNGEAKDKALGAVYEQNLALVTEGMKNGLSPAEIHNRIRSTYANNNELFSLTNLEQDAEVIKLADRLSEDGNVAIVKELLTSDRGGVGALGNKREFAADSVRIMDKAAEEQGKKLLASTSGALLQFQDDALQGKLNEQAFQDYAKANPKVLTPERVNALILQSRNNARSAQEQLAKQEAKVQAKLDYAARQGDITAQLQAVGKSGGLNFLQDIEIPNEEGTGMKALKADELRKRAVSEYFAGSDAVAKANNETADQKFSRDIGWVTQNGVINDQWKTLLASGYTAASAATIGADGQVPPALDAGYQVYEQMYAKNPRLIASHLNDQQAIDFYEAVRVARQEVGLPAPQAYQMAVQITRDPTKMNDSTLEPRLKEISGKLSELKHRSDSAIATYIPPLAWVGSLVGVAEAPEVKIDNLGMLVPKLERMARFYARLGLSAEDSMKKAGERLASSHIPINGWLIPTSDRNIGQPEVFKEIVEAYLKDIADRNKDDDIEMDDITIAPVGNVQGAWYVIHKSTGHLVGNGSWFTMGQLKDFTERHAQDRAAVTQWDQYGRSKEAIARETEIGRFEKEAAGTRNINPAMRMNPQNHN